MTGFTADVFTSKTFLVKGEVTHSVQLEFKATSKEDAEAQFSKRVREDNTIHVKIVSVQHKSEEKAWTGRPPGSPLRGLEPDLPQNPPPAPRKRNTKVKKSENPE